MVMSVLHDCLSLTVLHHFSAPQIFFLFPVVKPKLKIISLPLVFQQFTTEKVKKTSGACISTGRSTMSQPIY
jgi:hypothetical protein